MNTQLLRFSTLTVHPPCLARFRTNRSHHALVPDLANRAPNSKRVSLLRVALMRKETLQTRRAGEVRAVSRAKALDNSLMES